jgi:hypothetical protein
MAGSKGGHAVRENQRQLLTLQHNMEMIWEALGADYQARRVALTRKGRGWTILGLATYLRVSRNVIRRTLTELDRWGVLLRDEDRYCLTDAGLDTHMRLHWQIYEWANGRRRCLDDDLVDAFERQMGDMSTLKNLSLDAPRIRITKPS